ncbi:transmembrane 220 family protein [Leptospira santarosai]|uniref:transmembrane 220 family protein n=1 Tax=Leptospira santarosai TaxID=28183 RepID=UPI000774A637|nr:transmembrane 220 family protein [Leptospira santarosai]MDI7202168.1 transmembrane 220 family protein [Leptospira santarosai]
MDLRIMKTFSIVTILIWLVFAGLQWNDPDPWLWIPLYMSVVFLYAGFIIYPTKTKLWLGTSLILSVLFSAGTVLAAMQIPSLSFDDEVTRETGGLFLSAVWSGILGYRIRKRETQREKSALPKG